MKAVITFILLGLFIQSPEKDLPAAQAELVNSERAFAQLAEERGFRESFLTYFADEGIAFNPHPHKVRETLSRQPANNSPMGLKWAPAFGDISQAGDLGWNTGPVLFDSAEPGKPGRHGMFFSVWKKQADGSWRVVLDLGAKTPAEVVPLNAPFRSSFRPVKTRPANSVNIEREIAELLQIERDFLATAKAKNAGQAYLTRVGDDVRVHRPGVMPVTSKEGLRGWLQNQAMPLSGEPIKADVSRSGDLGYVYGSYELGGTKPEKGYYARVWKRDDSGQWRIVMDTVNPIPAASQAAAANAAPNRLGEKAEGHYLAQEWPEAAAAYLQYTKENPSDPQAWHRLGTSQIFLKQYVDGIKSLEQAIKLGGSGPLDFYNLACALALTGQTEKALDNLEKAIGGGFTNRQQYETDSDLNSLRETDRFKALLKRLP
jgi:ketosteroid isomerase-like protein